MAVMKGIEFQIMILSLALAGPHFSKMEKSYSESDALRHACSSIASAMRVKAGAAPPKPNEAPSSLIPETGPSTTS
jgi:hypothetical protein